ncbi:MAG: hypothetical protein U1E31_02370 [Rickettsiales bacterium]
MSQFLIKNYSSKNIIACNKNIRILEYCKYLNFICVSPLLIFFTIKFFYNMLQSYYLRITLDAISQNNKYAYFSDSQYQSLNHELKVINDDGLIYFFALVFSLPIFFKLGDYITDKQNYIKIKKKNYEKLSELIDKISEHNLFNEDEFNNLSNELLSSTENNLSNLIKRLEENYKLKIKPNTEEEQYKLEIEPYTEEERHKLEIESNIRKEKKYAKLLKLIDNILHFKFYIEDELYFNLEKLKEDTNLKNDRIKLKKELKKLYILKEKCCTRKEYYTKCLKLIDDILAYEFSNDDENKEELKRELLLENLEYKSLLFKKTKEMKNNLLPHNTVMLKCNHDYLVAELEKLKSQPASCIIFEEKQIKLPAENQVQIILQAPQQENQMQDILSDSDSTYSSSNEYIYEFI